MGFAKKEKVTDYDFVSPSIYKSHLKEIDNSNPIFLVHNTRVNNLSGNEWDDAGISYNSLLESNNYDRVGTALLYKSKDYSVNRRFYDCNYATIVDGKFKILERQSFIHEYLESVIAEEQKLMVWSWYIENKPRDYEYENIISSVKNLKLETWVKGGQDFKSQVSNETALNRWVIKCIEKPSEELSAEDIVAESFQESNQVNSTPAAAAATSESEQSINNQDNSFQVVSEKAYFYTEPNFNKRRKAYLVNGQFGVYTKTENSFIYATFTNSSGKKTEGWLSIDDINLNN